MGLWIAKVSLMRRKRAQQCLVIKHARLKPQDMQTVPGMFIMEKIPKLVEIHIPASHPTVRKRTMR